jgi:NADPH:quinone reductase-like Zn-dependent oxidoreductase
MGDLSDCVLGGFAQYAIAQENILVIKPANISFENAAAMPVASTTALHGLRNKGNIQKGQTVLIVGSSGGVGTFAIQLAKYFGADVTAVCSTRNIEQSLELGANQCIDYAKEDVFKKPARYDLIVAVNGNYPLLSYKRSLKKDGTYVMIGGSMKQILKSIFFGKLLSLGSKKMRFLSMKANKTDLEFIANMAEKNQIRSIIEKTYPLEKLALAIETVALGRAKGKVVITIQ